MKKSLAIFALLGVGVLAGCDSNPTNAPTEDAVRQANRDRAAAIDNDQSLNDEQKATMKKMMGLDKEPGSGGSR